MKLSDYVVQFIEQKTDSVFLLSGGGIMHLVDSIGRSKLSYYCCHHEQAVAHAAEGYARITNKPGFAIVTTGPGGTNALTGMAGAWLDSIPMFVIAGQTKTDNIAPRKNGAPTVRAIGFQELNVIDMAKPICKYAVTVEEPSTIRYHLERGWYEAHAGRPGPVFVELPLDITAIDIDPEKLEGFNPKPVSSFAIPNTPIDLVVQKLQAAKRPLLLVGNGIRLGGAVAELETFLQKTNINTATVIFTADDLVTYDYPKYLGRQGMPGNYAANWAIDNCDVLLVIGDRLQLTQTSYDYHKFATQAFTIMVDIDENELHKKTLQIDLPIHCDAKYFLQELNKQNITLQPWEVSAKPVNVDEYQSEGNYVNVYRFLEVLGKHHQGAPIATADGTASLTPHQALRTSPGQRFITNAGLGNMGSGLPLAVGACIASGKKPTICMEGDGSIMLNIHELQTILYHNLPIKIFIYNNNGYFSIRSTHQNYFKKVVASDPDSGLSLPDYSKLMPAWGFAYERIQSDTELDKVQRVMEHKGPIVCELMIDPAQKTLPKWAAGQLRENI
jgi:acetolactate synthase I/II/III large subunit